MSKEIPDDGDVLNDEIESLAKQCDMPREDIRHIYEHEYKQLNLHSRVKAFLPILCAKHVKQTVRKIKRTRPKVVATEV